METNRIIIREPEQSGKLQRYSQKNDANERITLRLILKKQSKVLSTKFLWL
jgi:hypothetical protein